MADYTLKIIVNAEDRASGALRGIRGALADLGGNVKLLGAVALSGLGAVAGAAAGAGAALGKLAIDAAPLQDIRAAFEGLAGSAGKSAEEMLAALERASGGMISQRDLMLVFNKAAQLVSADFAVRLPEAMQYLSKVAASTGQDMGFLLDSLVVGVGRLSPLILDNLGIQVSLSEATERAAQMFGLEADQLSESQVQAGMMALVLEKLRDNTAAMPDVTQGAAAQWARLRATLANLKDEVGLAFVPALSSLLSALQPLIQAALPVLSGLLERAGAAASAVASAIGAFISQIAAGIDPIVALQNVLAQFGLGEVAAVIGQVRDALAVLWEQIKPYVEQIVSWVSQHVELKDVLIALGIAIAAVVMALASLVSAVAPVVAAGALLIAAVAAVRTAWENDFLGIRTFVENTLTTIRQWWAAHGEQVITTVRAFLTALKEAWERFTAFWREIFAAFRAAFEGDWYAFGEHLRNAWDMAWENIKQIARTAINWFKSVDWGEVGRAIISGIADGIRAAANWLADAARDAARAALEAAKGFLGIRSPSRLFAEEVGRPIVEGWIRGIEALTPRLGLAVAGAAANTAAVATRPLESRTVIIYGGITVQGGGTMTDVLRQLWEAGYA